MFPRIRNIFRLSTRDYAHEWQMSGCFVLALAAILGPMMVLFGLKFGVVGGMLDQLIQDPDNREIRPVGSGRYDSAWIQALADRPDVAFIVPRTRSIAASIQLQSPGSGRILSVEMIPTGPGEPLVRAGKQIPIGINQILLSASAAQKLDVKKFDTLTGSVVRRFRGERERVRFTLNVSDVAEPEAFARDAVFAPVELVAALEDFLDGRAVPAMGWQGDAPDQDRMFPGFRLYAHSIYDVAGLELALDARGIEVRTRAADIALVQRMDRNLSAVFWAIAVIGLVGFALSLGASLWANVDRKRKELSVLRLVGFRTADIIWFPVIQAGYTAILGWLLACAIFFAAAWGINGMLVAGVDQAMTRGALCELLPEHYVIALGLTFSASVLSAALAGWRSARIAPSEGLRDI